VKSAVDVSSSALYRLTIRIRSDDTIRPNTNTLFGPLFGTEANIRYIPRKYTGWPKKVSHYHKSSLNVIKICYYI